MYQDRKNDAHFVPTSLHKLDSLLRGGIRSGMITEVCLRVCFLITLVLYCSHGNSNHHSLRLVSICMTIVVSYSKLREDSFKNCITCPSLSS